MQILGTRVDPVTKNEATERIRTMLSGGRQSVVTTPNPEIIMAAQRDPVYRAVLNRADLALPDGAGLLFVSQILGVPLPERVTGIDMVPEIIRIAAAQGKRVALVGSAPGVAERAARALRDKVLHSVICYASEGVSATDWANEAAHEKMVEEIRETEPDVLLVAFGHPKQELWIDRYRSKLPNVKLFMGVGGALDFIAGDVRRAPVIFRKLWIEWLWRLAVEPRRIGRIFTASVVFPLTVLHKKYVAKK
jgi:N-acetylglucosaminyldiphosphoundecaprenol N-acetyl-beta-D-mannosaminyltransferase